MSIVLYSVEFSPPCLAVLATAKSVGVKVEIKNVDILKGENQTESFRKINPAHSIPTMEDKNLRIWESRAIMCYLAQQYDKDSKLYPKDISRRARVDNMLYFDSSALTPSIKDYIIPYIRKNKPLNPEAETTMKDRLSILDQILSKELFVAGGDQPSLADISIRCTLFTPTSFKYSYEPYPNILKWIARFEAAMPIFKQVTSEGSNKQKEVFENLIAARA